MPRQSKSKSGVSETASAANITVSEQSAAVNTADKTAKPKKETKPKVKEEHSSVENVVVASEAHVSETLDGEVAELAATELAAQTTEFLAKLNQLGGLFASLKTEFRSLEKKWSREIKTAQKTNAKRKRKSGNRQPSGFVKPTKISDELAKFLEKPIGSEMARTDVTREINTYIRAHKLQDKDNGRKINPDAKLSTLLKLKKTDELTYFNLQRYMSPHFYKAEKPVLVAAASSA